MDENVIDENSLIELVSGWSRLSAGEMRDALRNNADTSHWEFVDLASMRQFLDDQLAIFTRNSSFNDASDEDVLLVATLALILARIGKNHDHSRRRNGIRTVQQVCSWAGLRYSPLAKIADRASSIQGILLGQTAKTLESTEDKNA